MDKLTDLQITWKLRGKGGSEWNFGSTKDVLENGAVFTQTGDVGLEPRYNHTQAFHVGDATSVRSLTWSAGALRCRKRSKSRC